LASIETPDRGIGLPTKIDLASRYHDQANLLGRTADVRRFLIALLLTTRYHLSSRPISNANTSFANRLTSSSDALLAVLGESGWDMLEDDIETGLVEMLPLAELPGRRDSSHEFRRIYKHRFGAMNPPWSDLGPSESLTINQWQSPQRILIAIGPNIGIGDELILFELARRLKRQWPGAELEVSSFNSGLWNLCDCVTVRRDPRDDQLDPYVHAMELTHHDPSALIVFAEFASTPIYRILERVAGLRRFVYVDTGARCARVIDHDTESIAEYIESGDGGVYATLHRLLERIGLSAAGDAFDSWPQLSPPRPCQSIPTVFVNPYSSKDFRVLDPSWWGTAVRTVASAKPLRLHIFAGINDECRAYARAIASDCGSIDVELLGSDAVPTIEETMRAALAADAVFGLDTFTAHIGVLAPVPCVTVSFGSAWDAWRVRNNHVLNTHVQSTPDSAGRLLLRLLSAVDEDSRRCAWEVTALTAAGATATIAADALSVFDQTAAAVERWHALDPFLSRDFIDVTFDFAARARSALARAVSERRDDASVRRLLRDVRDTWMGSNFVRYARFLV
jgi:hypothetical protein